MADDHGGRPAPAGERRGQRRHDLLAGGVRPGGSSIPYSVSKAAVNHMTKLLAKTLGPDVRVNAVAPGMIDTPWFDGVEGIESAMEETAARLPLRRVGRPQDIADAVFDLANASYITGEVLLVDGGGHLL